MLKFSSVLIQTTAYLIHILDSVEEVHVRYGIAQVGAEDVEAQSFGGLVGHLDSIL